MRVHLEAVNGMAQIGGVRTNVSVGNCGYNTSARVMWEFKVASPSSCTSVSTEVPYRPRPFTRRFTVQRTGGSGDWSVYYEGTFQDEASVGYDTASHQGGAGGEYFVSHDSALSADTSNNHSGTFEAAGWTIGTPSSPASPFVGERGGRSVLTGMGVLQSGRRDVTDGARFGRPSTAGEMAPRSRDSLRPAATRRRLERLRKCLIELRFS